MSAYLLKRKAELRRNIKTLVECTTGLIPNDGDGNYGRSVDYVRRSIDAPHQYVHPTPSKMDGVYEKLSEKFEAHNQDELAVALRDAKGRLRMCVPATTGETDMGGDEFHAVLLQFLLSLSNSPTNAKGALHYELPYRSSVEDGAPSEEDFDLDDDGLVGSDWTDPDTDLSEDDLDTAAMYRQQTARQQANYLQQRQQQGAQGSGVQRYARSMGRVNPELLRAQAFALAARFQPRYDLNFASHSELPREPVPPRAAHSALAELFSQQPSRLGQLWSDAELRRGPLHHELPRCRLDEFHIVKETLWMLAGADTFVFIVTIVDPNTAAFETASVTSSPPPTPKYTVVTTRRDLILSHITPTALATALTPFAAAGTDLRYLAWFVAEALSLSNEDGIPRTYQAFAAWLQTYLHEFHGKLVELERNLGAGGEGLGLSQLKAVMRGDLKKMHRLAALLKRGIPADWTAATTAAAGKEFNNARLSATLLEVLHSVAFEAEVVCPSNDGMGGLYMALFVRCIRPLVDGIESWITRGVLDDPGNEFPITHGRRKGRDSKIAGRLRDKHSLDYDSWTETHALRQCAGTMGSVATGSTTRSVHDKTTVPRFLLPVLEKLLMAGKSIWLLNTLIANDEINSGSVQQQREGTRTMYTSFAKTLAVAVPTPPASAGGIGIGGIIRRGGADGPAALQRMQGGQRVVTASFKSEEDDLLDAAVAVVFEEIPSESPAVTQDDAASTREELPPWRLAASLQVALDHQIERQYEEASGNLLTHLKESHALVEHTRACQSIFLLESGDFMHPLCCQLFEQMMNKEAWHDDAVLTSLLQTALLPTVWRKFAHQIRFRLVRDPHDRDRDRDHTSYAGAGAGAGAGAVHPEATWTLPVGLTPLAAVDLIHLDFDVEWPVQSAEPFPPRISRTLIPRMQLPVAIWPVSAAISLASIVGYGDIFQFLLKIKMSKWMVDEVYTRGIDPSLRTNPLLIPMVHRFHLLRMRISHVINSLSTFVMTRVVHSLGLEFQEKLDAATDLDQVRQLHDWYVGELKDRCLLRDRAAAVNTAILEIFNAAYDCRRCWDTICLGAEAVALEAAVVDAELEFRLLERRFKKAVRFLVTLLEGAVKKDIYPHLAGLYESIKGADTFDPIFPSI